MVPDGRTDGMDGRNGRSQNYIPPTSSGDKNKGTDMLYVAVFCNTIQLISIKLYIKFQNPKSSSC